MMIDKSIIEEAYDKGVDAVILSPLGRQCKKTMYLHG
jgi:hypothetical protein